MLNIILYILISSGIGYFIFLIYKKWPQIQEEDSSTIRFSINGIKKVPQKLFLCFRQMVRKCRGLKNCKFFCGRGKIWEILSGRARNTSNTIKKNSKKQAQKAIIIIKKIKFPKIAHTKPLFERKPLEENEKLFFKKEETNPKFFDIKKSKKFFLSTLLKIRKKIRKRRFCQFYRGNLYKKIKNYFISEEDQKIKKQLNKTKEVIINPESYLGELLKKTKEEKAIAKETKNLSSKNDIIKKPLAEPVAKKNIKIAESIKSIKTLKGLKTIKNKVIKIIRDVNNRRVSKLDGRLKNYKFFDGRLSKLGGRLKRKILKKIKRKKTKKKNKIFAKEEIEKRTKEAKESKQFMTFSKIEISEEAIKKIENKLISEILEDSKNIEAYKKLGKVYYNQDKYHHAVECFKAALKLGSGDKKIKDLLKECEEKLNLPT